MDEYDLIPQDILRQAIADFYEKTIKGQQEKIATQDVDDVVEDKRENSRHDNDYIEPIAQPNQGETIEERWEQFYRQLQIDIATHGEISKRTGQLDISGI